MSDYVLEIALPLARDLALEIEKEFKKTKDSVLKKFLENKMKKGIFG